MKKKNKMLRMWVLYGLFLGIILLCAGLFFFNVVTGGDNYHLDNLEHQFQNDNTYGLIITDLYRTDNAYRYDTPVPSPEGLQLQARTNSFDLLLTTQDMARVDGSRMRWVMALQRVAVLCMAFIFGLVLVLMVKMFLNIRRGRLFNKGSVRLIGLIGIMVIVFTLSLDTSTYLERLEAYALLKDTAWEPMHDYTLHATRLFVGLIVLFLSETLRVGMDMQEEQDLTI